MRKSWGLTQKIAGGEKIIESRWYMKRSAPWGMVNAGDEVYFKDSGEPVTLKARVLKVLQFDSLTPSRVKLLLQEYGAQDGLSESDIPRYYELFKNKRYCLLIFLTDVRPVEPFNINKAGYGAMAAWMCVGSVQKVKI